MPVLLTRFVTGVNSSAAVPYVAQGFVNRTSSDTSAPGGVGGNEWTIDGATNNGSDRRLASSPNSDMIEEVRIETANFDASFGHGTGLGISMMTRSGTNATRGTLNYQYWNNQWNAPRYFAKRNYYANIEQARARGDNALADSLASQKINSDRQVEQHRDHARRPDHPQQALRVRELLVQQRRPAGEPDPAHDSDRRASARGFLGPARDRSRAVSDLRSADRQARSRASRVFHPRSVSRQHHSAEPDHQPDVPALRQVSAEAEQQPDRSAAGADQQLSRAHLHRSDPEPDLRRAFRLQPLEHAPVLRTVERQLLHRRARRLDVPERRRSIPRT